MQRDKRLLALDDDRHLLDSVLAALTPLEAPIFLAASALDAGRPVLPGVVVLWDRVPHAGPLRALVGASELIAGEILVVAADLPRLSTPFLRSLLESAKLAPQAWAVVPRAADRLQPLCALYREAIWPALGKRSSAGESSLLEALVALPKERLHEWPVSEGDSLENWNRPEDRWDGISR
jgi:molybdopterin-guanine dinucleotide biosynthesis protein A